MTIHILKLCVGCDAIDDLAARQRQRLADLRKADPVAELMHVTRQTPRREGFPANASIYWIMGGVIRARQRITALREVRGADGILRCGLVLHPQLIATETALRRPFQGWRYLAGEDAPADIDVNAAKFDSAIPPAMRTALMELRLI